MTLLKTRNGDSALIDQVVDTFFDLQWPPRFTYTGTPLDLYEKDGQYVLEMPTPGLEPKEIDVEINGSTVTISGKHSETFDKTDVRYHHREIRRGSFSRSVTLPQELDPNSVKAVVDKGILRLTLMPSVPFTPKKIEVKAG